MLPVACWFQIWASTRVPAQSISLRMRFWLPRAALCCLALGWLEAPAQTYILASPDSTLNTGGWSLSSANLSGFRSAITNPVYFGPSGTVPVTISITDLSTINSSTLSGVNGFIEPWWPNNDAQPYESQAMTNAVVAAFHSGMDLWLLEDDSNHNALGTALGLVASPADGTVSNGTRPLFSGPFGTATNTATYGNFSYFDSATIASLGGTIIGTNASGQATAVYWQRGAFAAGSGALIVFSDVDMISNWQQNPYSPTLNANGILALNTMDTLAAVPEPGTWALLATGLSSLLLMASRRRRL